ncbi:hypothetical protein [Pararhodobacter oceanensis]|uniref:Cytochrome C oxidase assembly protein n=1 Tax=Pararhodobacter oceanensis TaxID=2172121 RepID=A0A2T8HUA5_9RHOB|nr:hypothetical protein [Pararhodobacter oceanensis]PVH28985.1 hypothetical protein DDE20_08080 [Pararhodobacter oceanensis]
MAIHQDHELHTRRWSRNLGVGLTLAAFIALVFGLTVVKVQNGSLMQGADHTYRSEIDPANQMPVAEPEQ